MNRFVIAEPQKCIGCRTCEIACALAHIPKGSDQPLSPANFRPRLTVIKSATISTPVMCHHCDDAPCLNGCPTGAIVYSGNSVQVVQERCIGCKTCMVACPFGVMQVVTAPQASNGKLLASSRPAKAQALKCDLCVDHETGPACLSACPTKAISLVDNAQLEAAVRRRQEQTALDSPNMLF